MRHFAWLAWVCMACGADAEPARDSGVDAAADATMDATMDATVDAGCRPTGNSLEAYCQGRTCPQSQAEAIMRICNHDRFFRGGWSEANACDGVTIVNYIGNSTTQYHFDGSGQLVGITQSDDVPFCAGAFARSHGRNCLPDRTGGVRPGSLCDDDAGADDAGR